MYMNSSWNHVMIVYYILIIQSEVDKSSIILIKTSSAAEYIELNIQTIETPRIDDPII